MINWIATVGVVLLTIIINAITGLFVFRFINDRVARKKLIGSVPLASAMHSTAMPEFVVGPLVVVPRFGNPELVKYQPEDYEEPLRCSSGAECGTGVNREGRVLRPGEYFIKIPQLDDPDERFFVLCAEDVRIVPGALPPEVYLPKGGSGRG